MRKYIAMIGAIAAIVVALIIIFLYIYTSPKLIADLNNPNTTVSSTPKNLSDDKDNSNIKRGTVLSHNRADNETFKNGENPKAANKYNKAQQTKPKDKNIGISTDDKNNSNIKHETALLHNRADNETFKNGENSKTANKYKKTRQTKPKNKNIGIPTDRSLKDRENYPKSAKILQETLAKKSSRGTFVPPDLSFQQQRESRGVSQTPGSRLRTPPKKGSILGNDTSDAFTIRINNSENKKPIDDAKVSIERQRQTWEYYSKSGGYVSLRQAEFIDDDQAKITIEAPGFIRLTDKCPCNLRLYSISSILKPGAYRIVLNWGPSPLDLDSHLWYGDDHLWYAKMNGKKAKIDVDAKDGFGPETITIDERLPGMKYIYAVHNFANRKTGSSSSLSDSDATVYLYEGYQLKGTFEVPTSTPGTKWVVFSINESGEINSINHIRSDAVNSGMDLKPAY